MTENTTNNMFLEINSIRSEYKSVRESITYLTKVVDEIAKKVKHKEKSKVDGFITIKQLTEKLSVTTATVHNWFKNKILTKYKIGGRTYIDPTEIEFIEMKGRK